MSRVPVPPQLLIRADAGPRVGNGHVMRCLALAQAWQEAGGDVTFACVALPAQLRQRLESERCRVEMIEAVPGTARDARSLLSIAGEMGARAIVLDGYRLGTNFQRSVRTEGRPVMVIDDDGCHGRYCADIILNPNPHAAPVLYARRSPSGRLLLGSRHLLLRREFRQCKPRRRFPGTARRVLVMVGGTGIGSAIARTLRSVAAVVRQGIEVLVISPNATDGDTIIRLAGNLSGRLEFVVDPPNLAQRMAWADVAVTAAGSTVWELLSLGVPTLAFPISANQRLIAKRLREEGLAVVESPFAPKVFRKAFAQLIRDAALRRALSRRSRSTVRPEDGAAQVVTLLLTDVGG